jgi:signal peptidase I
MASTMEQPPVAQETPKPSTLKQFIDNALYIITAVVLALIVQQFIIRPFVVNGESMSPTLETGNYLIIDEVTYKFSQPARGDVVVFKAPPEPTKFYIKRIVGLPGDTVSISGSTVTITNAEHPKGFVLKEAFITHPMQNTLSEKVPEGEYFVMGDNRAGSYDSRMWGFLPKANLRGRALLRLLPLKQIDYLPGKVNYE